MSRVLVGLGGRRGGGERGGVGRGQRRFRQYRGADHSAEKHRSGHSGSEKKGAGLVLCHTDHLLGRTSKRAWNRVGVLRLRIRPKGREWLYLRADSGDRQVGGYCLAVTRMLKVIEPATEKVMAEVPEAGVEEADEAGARDKAACPAGRGGAP